MSFVIHLKFDEFSTKGRMNASMKSNLELLFAVIGKKFENNCLRLASNTKTNTARSSTYVLNEGVIDSSLCFSFSRYKSEKSLWITPNGWKTASVVCSSIFTGESRLIDLQMKYRFAKVDLHNGMEIFGQWHTNIQTAFAFLDPLFSEEVRKNLTKVSKEIILGIHTLRVQALVWDDWNRQKSEMSPDQLALALAYEKEPDIEDYPLPTSTTLLPPPPPSSPSLLPKLTVVEPPSDPFGILTALEITTVLTEAKRHPVSQVHVEEILFLLEGGLGATMKYFFHFLELVESTAHKVWLQLKDNVSLRMIFSPLLEEHASGSTSIGRAIDTYSLPFRAMLFVCMKLLERFPVIPDHDKKDVPPFVFDRAMDFPCFLSNLTLLPSVNSARTCFSSLFPH